MTAAAAMYKSDNHDEISRREITIVAGIIGLTVAFICLATIMMSEQESAMISKNWVGMAMLFAMCSTFFNLHIMDAWIPPYNRTEKPWSRRTTQTAKCFGALCAIITFLGTAGILYCHMGS